MSCEADITTAVKRDVLVVPIQALTVREAKVDVEGKFIATADEKDPRPGVVSAETGAREKLKELQGVFLLAADGLARFRPVKTGIVGEMDIEVLEGLEPGEKVIVGPLKALRTLKENDGVVEDREHPFRRTLRKRAGEDEENKGGGP
jgi:HlyD family secretion protein